MPYERKHVFVDFVGLVAWFGLVRLAWFGARTHDCFNATKCCRNKRVGFIKPYRNVKKPYRNVNKLYRNVKQPYRNVKNTWARKFFA